MTWTYVISNLKAFVVKKVLSTMTGTYVISNLKSEEIVETFYKK